ncbi:MAG: PaaI family thioesterase [bacterium]
MALTVRDPDFEARVRASFAKQTFMATLGARLASIVPGEVTIALPYRADLAQQHGFLHAGVVTSVVDSACGYAALTLMEPGAAVLSVEFKVNLLAPAAGREFLATGRVVRAGRTITVCSGDLRALDDGDGVVVAVLQGTMMSVRDKVGLSD